MQTQTFRPTSSRVLAVAGWAVAVTVTIGAVATGDVAVVSVAVPAAGLGALAVWALYWRPQVEVSPAGVTLVNVLRTVHVPWPVLEDAVAGWSLVVRSRDHAWTAWAAPRGSGVAELSRNGRGRLTGRLANGAGAATAGSVAAAIRTAHDGLVAAGHLDGARSAAERAGLHETVTWHRGTITGALALLCVVVAAAVA